MASSRPSSFRTSTQKLRAENTSHFMLAYMRARTRADDKEVAELFLRASWEAETHNPRQVSRYRALALEKLEAVLARNRHWWAVLLAAELERLLGRFEAADARLAAVPAEALDTDDARALQQIRKHAQGRNSEPELFVDK